MQYDRLSPQDASFLFLESGPVHMHVGSVMIFNGNPPAFDELVAHVERRLHLVPRFRQRLAHVPFRQGRPVWIDDPHLNLSYHLRESALPDPGGDAELKQLAGRIMSQRLDRTKPLWEIYLVEGLEGDRFALIGKTHHCLVDGVSGVDITTVLFDTQPQPQVPPASGDGWQPGPEPSRAQLLADSLIERSTKPAEIVRGIQQVFRTPGRIAARIWENAVGLGLVAREGLTPAPQSPINKPIGHHRRLAWVESSLADFKAVKNELGGTVNDVVLAVITGALRRFLPLRGSITEGLELKAMVPVSVRTEHERGTLGNRVAAVIAPLPVYMEDPVKRLRYISEAMAGLKESRQAVGAQALTQLSGFAPSTILSQAARLQSVQRFFNISITNVPGPQFPLYVLGRELEAVYPMVPVTKNQILGIAAMSYSGKVFFGLIGDFDEMPDLDIFAEYTVESLQELLDCAHERELVSSG